MVADQERLPLRTLILGGARSGKSARGLLLAEREARISSAQLVLLATARAQDAEMTARIARHRAQRGPQWQTLEEPLDLAGALVGQASGARIVVLDCVTLWLSNVILEDDARVPDRIDRFLEVMARLGSTCAPGFRLILVSNEVGFGIVPDNALARRFRDVAGELNQALAHVCDAVTLMVAGQPVSVKRPGPDAPD